MSTVIKIFKKDLLGLGRNIMALIVAIGLCLIPSLYAWFNIYSNWDPYANTAALKVAIVSCDKGYEESDGNVVNMGDKIIDQLHDNDKLGWLFCDSTDTALDGLYSGEYYAAIIINEDFSKSMYDFLADGFKHPSVTYYENSKKNAVASKITDTGMSTLQQNINTEFINVVASTAIESMNALSDPESSKLSTLIENISSINDNMVSYSDTIDTFVSTNNKLSDNLLKIKDTLPEVQQVLDSTVNTANTAEQTVSDTVNSMISKIDVVMSVMTQKSQSIKEHLEATGDMATTNTDGAVEELNAAADDIQDMIDQNKELEEVIDELSKLNLDNAEVIINLKNNLTTVEVVEELSKKLIEQSSQIVADAPVLIELKYELLTPILEECSNKISSINDVFQNVIKSQVADLQKSLSKSVTELSSSITQAGSSLTGMEQLLLGTSNIILTANSSLSETQTIISRISGKISSISEKLNDVNDNEVYQTLMKLLKADAATYAEFLASPVEITQMNVFSAVNYGTSVTPFYTTLALWVGAIILVALIKVHVDYDSDLVKNARLSELYFGRFMLFFVMGQIQAAVIVWGDLYLLKIVCDNPTLLFITAAIASMVFTLFIYTLVLSFGDVGKAIAVVMVVIQIAGSSGTYPIELLPEFFKKVYLYFPFPYAINAMREAISGCYEDAYYTYITKLLIFVIVSLVIGLVIRKPFMGLNEFMEKRMKDTDMM